MTGHKINIPPISIISLAAFFVIEPSYYLIMMLSAVILHELGHILTMKLLGIKIQSVTLLPLGIDIKAIPSFISYPKSALISFSGPAVNLLLFLLFFNSGELLCFFSLFNLLYALFNLLPIRGLDGGAVIQNILNCFFSFEKTEKLLTAISFVFCIFLWFLGSYILLILNGNITIFALSVFLCISLFIKKQL